MTRLLHAIFARPFHLFWYEQIKTSNADYGVIDGAGLGAICTTFKCRVCGTVETYSQNVHY